LPPRAVEVVWVDERGGIQRHIFRGVPLNALLQAAGPQLGPERDAAGAYVVVTGRDGYSAVVAFGEYAPRLGAERILVAWERDGALLPPGQAPAQLVVPDDQRAERAVWGIARIELRSANAPDEG